MLTLFLNHLRRTLPIGFASCIALFGFQVLVCRVYKHVSNSGGPAQMMKMMPKWAQAALNIDPESMGALNGFLSIAYQHPFVLAVLLAVPVAIATGLLSGEVERRTLGLLLARPVGRATVVISTAITCLLWTGIAVACMVAGTYTGRVGADLPDTVNRNALFTVAANLYLLALAVTAIALAVAASLNERADAIGWCVTIVLVMYVWNFLAQVWASAGGAVNYSLFNYYNPASILLRGVVEPVHFQVLGSVAAVGPIVALIIFRFRNFSV